MPHSATVPTTATTLPLVVLETQMTLLTDSFLLPAWRVSRVRM